MYGIFAACLPTGARRQLDGQPVRRRQGMVPDFLIHAPWDGPEQPVLMELKTLHYGTSTYPDGAGRCSAVARRARMLPAEYRRKARKLDRTLCATPEGTQGPVERQLQQFGNLRGLVFGAWAETSPDVELLLSLASRVGAERHWQTMGARDATLAQGVLAWLLRRRWGMAALRENAHLKLEHLEYVGRGAADAMARRHAAAVSSEARARSTAVLDAVRGPRIRGLGR